MNAKKVLSDTNNIETDCYKRKNFLLVSYNVPIGWISEYRSQQGHAGDIDQFNRKRLFPA